MRAGTERSAGARVAPVMNKRDSFPSRASLRGTIDPRVLILALGTFAIGTDAFIIGGILPMIAHDLSVSVGKAGLVASVFSLSYALGSPTVSALSGRSRRSSLIIGGLAVFSAANLLSALSPTLACLLATRVIAALSAGLVAPACYALASTLGPSHSRGKTLGSSLLGLPVPSSWAYRSASFSASTPAGGAR